MTTLYEKETKGFRFGLQIIFCIVFEVKYYEAYTGLVYNLSYYYIIVHLM